MVSTSISLGTTLLVRMFEVVGMDELYVPLVTKQLRQ